MENKNNLCCPCCKVKLIFTHMDRYETIEEHVENPNQPYSLKPAFQCPKQDCIFHKFEISWIEDGDYFFSRKHNNVVNYVKFLESETENGLLYALNSFSYYYYLGKKKTKKREITLKIWKYTIVIVPKIYGHNYPLEKRYMPRKFGWKFYYSKIDTNGD